MLKELFMVKIVGISESADQNAQKYVGIPGIQFRKNRTLFEFDADPNDTNEGSRQWVPKFNPGYMPRDIKFLLEIGWVYGRDSRITFLVISQWTKKLTKPLFTAPVFDQHNKKLFGQHDIRFRLPGALVAYVKRSGVAAVEEISAFTQYRNVWLMRADKLVEIGLPFGGGADFLKDALPPGLKEIAPHLFAGYEICTGKKKYEDLFPDWSMVPQKKTQGEAKLAPQGPLSVPTSAATPTSAVANTTSRNPRRGQREFRKVIFGESPETILIRDYQVEALQGGGITTLDQLLNPDNYPKVEKLLGGDTRFVCSKALDAKRRTKPSKDVELPDKTLIPDKDSGGNGEPLEAEPEPLNSAKPEAPIPPPDPAKANPSEEYRAKFLSLIEKELPDYLEGLTRIVTPWTGVLKRENLKEIGVKGPQLRRVLKILEDTYKPERMTVH